MVEPPTAATLTGLVLAGGLGQRMGGLDKGLQPFHGQPLAQRALQRLRPQVAQLAINANRHHALYGAWGVPVWSDLHQGFAGPLAGFLTGLKRSSTPWLLTVACDTPAFPQDLAARLVQEAQRTGSLVTMAASSGADGQVQPEPVFCLLHRSLAPSLQQALTAGERRVRRWAGQQGCTMVVFNPADAFANANTPEQLAALEQANPANAAPANALKTCA